MTELGLSPGLTDSRALITSLISLVETWPMLSVESTADCLSATRLSAHSSIPKGLLTPRSLDFSTSAALSPETLHRPYSFKPYIQQTTVVKAVLPFISYVIKG